MRENQQKKRLDKAKAIAYTHIISEVTKHESPARKNEKRVRRENDINAP